MDIEYLTVRACGSRSERMIDVAPTKTRASRDTVQAIQGKLMICMTIAIAPSAKHRETLSKRATTRQVVRGERFRLYPAVLRLSGIRSQAASSIVSPVTNVRCGELNNPTSPHSRAADSVNNDRRAFWVVNGRRAPKIANTLLGLRLGTPSSRSRARSRRLGLL